MSEPVPISAATAAAAAGVSRSGWNTLAGRARAAGIELHAPRELWPDQRTPMYDAGRVREYLATRPGRGRRGVTGGE